MPPLTPFDSRYLTGVVFILTQAGDVAGVLGDLHWNQQLRGASFGVSRRLRFARHDLAIIFGGIKSTREWRFVMKDGTKTQLLGCDQSELDELVVQTGQPEYRGRQLFEAIYRQRLGTVDEISTLPGD